MEVTGDLDKLVQVQHERRQVRRWRKQQRIQLAQGRGRRAHYRVLGVLG